MKGIQISTRESNEPVEGFEKKVDYAGVTCVLWGVYNSETEPNWDDMCQFLVDKKKGEGLKACIVHKGNMHALYVQPIYKDYRSQQIRLY